MWDARFVLSFFSVMIISLLFRVNGTHHTKSGTLSITLADANSAIFLRLVSFKSFKGFHFSFLFFCWTNNFHPKVVCHMQCWPDLVIVYMFYLSMADTSFLKSNIASIILWTWIAASTCAYMLLDIIFVLYYLILPWGNSRKYNMELNKVLSFCFPTVSPLWYFVHPIALAPWIFSPWERFASAWIRLLLIDFSNTVVPSDSILSASSGNNCGSSS